LVDPTIGCDFGDDGIFLVVFLSFDDSLSNAFFSLSLSLFFSFFQFSFSLSLSLSSLSLLDEDDDALWMDGAFYIIMSFVCGKFAPFFSFFVKKQMAKKNENSRQNQNEKLETTINGHAKSK
tara:strand:- start:748 stop:1113 length:366 start_codon:yes stop_codon:yes gene_type:complete